MIGQSVKNFLSKIFITTAFTCVCCAVQPTITHANTLFDTNQTQTIQLGDQGNDVAEIQSTLADLGYDLVSDGDFGPGTAQVVREFQKKNRLAATGFIDKKTYAVLMGRAMPENLNVNRGAHIKARRIVQTAMQYLGVPYVWGGTTPRGFDCSGYIQYVFAKSGIMLPRTADSQYEMGYPVATENLRTGDLVFFSTYEPGPSHIGIYLNDGRFIHAASSSGVRVDSLFGYYWSVRYIGARRILK